MGRGLITGMYIKVVPIATPNADGEWRFVELTLDKVEIWHKARGWNTIVALAAEHTPPGHFVCAISSTLDDGMKMALPPVNESRG